MISLSPPTDNLYKFVAISGLVLIVGSFFIIYSASTFYGGKQIVLIEQLYSLEESKDELLKVLGVNLDDAVAVAAADTVAIDKRIELVAVQIEVNSKNIGFTKVLVGLMFGIGFALGGLGFFLWWKKVQRYLDAELEASVNLKSRRPSYPSPSNGKRYLGRLLR